MTPHPATDSALKAVERWTGHDHEKRAARDACGVMVLIACLVAVLMFLSGCTVASGSWGKYASFGGDAEGITKDGIARVNNSTAFVKGADTVKGMWSNTLTGMVAKYTLGKYYDNKGVELSASKTVELEKLRNAKSVTDATAAQKALETKLAAEAAAHAAGGAGQLVPGI